MRVMNHLRGIVDRVEITGCLPDCFIGLEAMLFPKLCSIDVGMQQERCSKVC
jgi:hypothetical protein